MKQNKIINPLTSSWGYKQDAGEWDMKLPSEFTCYSLEEQKKSYRKAIDLTLESFSLFARFHSVLITSAPKSKTIDNTLIEWKLEENYNQYIKRVLKFLRDYPDNIYEIDIKADLNVFVYTEKFSKQPIRAWTRYFEESLEMASFNISISQGDSEPYIFFFIEHTLFCPLPFTGNEDNQELFELNQPYLKCALRNWEQQFNSKIEAEGLGEIYEYGFLA